MSFPPDDYTPYGYLDNPAHTRNLHPLGVVRSFDVGFRWHFPAHAGLYGGRRETYRAGVRVALDGALELEALSQATSRYHSRNLMSFEITRGKARAVVEWMVVGEHALQATISAQHARRISLHTEYTRLLSANGEWGESGLVGRIEDGLLVLQGFEDGDAFVLWASHPTTDLGITDNLTEATAWANSAAPGPPADGFTTALGERGDLVTLYGVCGFDQPADTPIELILARGKTVAEARARLDDARREAGPERARKQIEDDQFWASAPQLTGDWPAQWRRGLVYDLETIRMMVKAPTGIYRHPWDAMQIQAPRVVLAEAAMDALVLGYADPGMAQELMYGAFADAPAPNVPCSREDGSLNMVAADGTACGTAPEWGYPWIVLERLDALRPDPAWLARIYPRLTEHLDWWTMHRRDPQGWMRYACSWESGQDNSPRFGDQPLGGGHPTWHIRPVDLHAALAHAAGVMENFATRLGLPDATKWRERASEWRGQTDMLWNGTRYADWDTRQDVFTTIDDVMLLAPLGLGIAEPARIEASDQAVAALDPTTLVWPMFVWTAVEAARAVGNTRKAAELAGAICERAYGFWDARPADPQRTLPGISCEYWPLSGRCGGEGYGWGAFTTHLLLDTLIGIEPTPTELRLRPNLPLAWREADRSYTVRLHLRQQPVTITLEPLDAERVRLTLNHQQHELMWGEQRAFAWETVPAR